MRCLLFFLSSLFILEASSSLAQEKLEGQDPALDRTEFIDISDNSFEGDTIETFVKKSKLDPKRASLLSAVLPGLGQIYNGQLWKVPIIYGGAALFGTWISYNHRQYQIFKNDELRILNFNDSKLRSTADLTLVQRNRESFRRDRDYAIIISMLFYALNIVDAHVSAHLKEFEVNEDLSMKIDPYVETNIDMASNATYGFKLRLSFK